jgi:group I intron endonuclease
MTSTNWFDELMFRMLTDIMLVVRQNIKAGFEERWPACRQAPLGIKISIYRYTCTISGKPYVGQTRKKVRVRWHQHVSAALTNSDHQCQALSRAIRKYGRQSFVCEVLAVADSQEEANLLESFWIAASDSLSPNGYNLSYGGDVSGVISDETRKKISANTKRQLAAMTPKERSERVRQAILNSTTFEERSARAFRAWHNQTSEQLEARLAKFKKRPPMSEEERRRRSERARANWAAMSAKERSQKCAHMRSGGTRIVEDDRPIRVEHLAKVVPFTATVVVTRQRGDVKLHSARWKEGGRVQSRSIGNELAVKLFHKLREGKEANRV